jgi:hypothetical protein
MLRLGLPGVALIVAWAWVGMIAGATFGDGRSRVRRALSGLGVVVLFVVPFFAPREERLARGIAALGAMLALMRWVESSRATRPPILPRAILFVLPVDGPSLAHARPRVATESLARAAVHAVVLAIGAALVWFAPASLPARWPLRWLGGVLIAYGYIDVAASLARASLATIGLDVDSMQRDPILAKSASEHWGERWNRVVSSWLWRHVFLPVTRRTRSPRLALIAAFSFSVILHAFMTLAALDVARAITMGAYFAVQGAVVLLEGVLPIAGWPTPLQRAWTIVVVAGPSWLFVGPMLAMFGVP